MLMVGVYDKSPDQGGKLIFDASPWASALSITTDAHGFAACSLAIRQSLAAAMQLYDVAGPLHIGVYDGAGVVWEGRIEDPGLTSGDDGSGNSLAAYGYSRAMADVPYTELWVDSSVESWMTLDERAMSENRPDRFEFKQDNRLYIAPKKNEVFGNSPLIVGRIGFQVPSGSNRLISRVRFGYDINMLTNWSAALQGFTVSGAAWTFSSTLWSITSAGAGTVDVTLATPAPAIAFAYWRNTNPNAAYTNETGDHYYRIANLRIQTSTSAAIYADEIAKALVAYVNAVNPGQISSSTALIQSPALDLRSELYEDALPSDILSTLASRGDSQSPPRLWEWGVWETQRLHFRPRGSAGRVWYVDATDIDVTRSLANMSNSAYASYQDANGDTVRGATSTDTASVARYGLTRRASVSADTTSATEASAQRDAFLNDRKDPLPSAKISFSAVYDAAGGRWPLWWVRSGDQIVIRNLPLGNASLDRVRQFRISTTSYDAMANTLSIEPEAPPATLETMLARSEIGY